MSCLQGRRFCRVLGPILIIENSRFLKIFMVYATTAVQGPHSFWVLRTAFTIAVLAAALIGMEKIIEIVSDSEEGRRRSDAFLQATQMVTMFFESKIYCFAN